MNATARRLRATRVPLWVKAGIAAHVELVCSYQKQSLLLAWPEPGDGTGCLRDKNLGFLLSPPQLYERPLRVKSRHRPSELERQLRASRGHASMNHQSGAEPMASRSECIVACLAGCEYRPHGEQFETRALTLFTDI